MQCLITLASFDDPKFKGHDTQYFEEFTNRSIYVDGRRTHNIPCDLATGHWERDRWELYTLDKDLSGAVDLADKLPEKLAEVKAKFDEAAEKYQVYPLDDRGCRSTCLTEASGAWY